MIDCDDDKAILYVVISRSFSFFCQRYIHKALLYNYKLQPETKGQPHAPQKRSIRGRAKGAVFLFFYFFSFVFVKVERG